MSNPGIRPGAYRSIMESASESLYCCHQANLYIDKAMFSIERSAIQPENPNRKKTLSSMEVSKRKLTDLAASPSQAIVSFAIDVTKYTIGTYGYSGIEDMLADQYISVPQPILTVMQGIGFLTDVAEGGDESARWLDIGDSLDEISISSISGTLMTWDWIGSVGISA